MYVFEAIGIHTLIFPRLIKGYSFCATIVLYFCGYHDITFRRLFQILKFAPSGSSTKTLLHYIQCHRSKKLKPYEDYETEFPHFRNNINKPNKSPSKENKRERKISDDGYKTERSVDLMAPNSPHEVFLWDKEFGWHKKEPSNNEDVGPVKLRKDRNQNDLYCYSLDCVTIPTSLWWGEADWVSNKENVSRIVQELPNVVGCHRIPKSTFGHLDFLWGRVGSFYEELNQNLDDTTPVYLEELNKSVHSLDNDTEVPPSFTDYALFWYVKSICANVRHCFKTLFGVIFDRLSSVSLY